MKRRFGPHPTGHCRAWRHAASGLKWSIHSFANTSIWYAPSLRRTGPASSDHADIEHTCAVLSRASFTTRPAGREDFCHRTILLVLEWKLQNQSLRGGRSLGSNNITGLRLLVFLSLNGSHVLSLHSCLSSPQSKGEKSLWIIRGEKSSKTTLYQIPLSPYIQSRSVDEANPLSRAQPRP